MMKKPFIINSTKWKGTVRTSDDFKKATAALGGLGVVEILRLSNKWMPGTRSIVEFGDVEGIHVSPVTLGRWAEASKINLEEIVGG